MNVLVKMEDLYVNLEKWFPGGEYRINESNTIEINPVLARDIDAILADQGFDLNLYNQLAHKISELIEESLVILIRTVAEERKATPDESKEYQRIMQEVDTITGQIAQMKEPVGDALIAKGYSDEELTG